MYFVSLYKKVKFTFNNSSEILIQNPRNISLLKIITKYECQTQTWNKVNQNKELQIWPFSCFLEIYKE